MSYSIYDLDTILYQPKLPEKVKLSKKGAKKARPVAKKAMEPEAPPEPAPEPEPVEPVVAEPVSTSGVAPLPEQKAQPPSKAEELEVAVATAELPKKLTRKEKEQLRRQELDEMVFKIDDLISSKLEDQKSAIGSLIADYGTKSSAVSSKVEKIEKEIPTIQNNLISNMNEKVSQVQNKERSNYMNQLQNLRNSLLC